VAANTPSALPILTKIRVARQFAAVADPVPLIGVLIIALVAYWLPQPPATMPPAGSGSIIEPALNDGHKPNVIVWRSTLCPRRMADETVACVCALALFWYRVDLAGCAFRGRQRRADPSGQGKYWRLKDGRILHGGAQQASGDEPGQAGRSVSSTECCRSSRTKFPTRSAFSLACSARRPAAPRAADLENAIRTGKVGSNDCSEGTPAAQTGQLSEAVENISRPSRGAALDLRCRILHDPVALRVVGRSPHRAQPAFPGFAERSADAKPGAEPERRLTYRFNAGEASHAGPGSRSRICRSSAKPGQAG